MALHLTVDPHSGYPIYLQLVEQIRRAVAVGVLKPGDQLPTVKQISSDLVVNPSTVARALRELEHLSVIESFAGRGSFVSGGGAESVAQSAADASTAQAVDGVVRDARSLGVDGQTLRSAFEAAYERWYERKRNGELPQ